MWVERGKDKRGAHVRGGCLWCVLAYVIVDKKLTSFHQYLGYSHKCGTIAFGIAGAIIWAYSQIASLVSAKVSLFAYVIYIWDVLHCGQWRPSWINNIFKWANYVGFGASKMKLTSYDGACYNECNGIKLCLYSRYWWSKVNFLSTKITFARV